jgi:hypothetical protein
VVRGRPTKHSTVVRALQGARTSLGQHPSQAFGRSCRVLRPMASQSRAATTQRATELDASAFAAQSCRRGSVWIDSGTIKELHDSTGKKTPGGAGTHTSHTGRTQDTRAHKGTRVTPTNLTTIQPSKSANTQPSTRTSARAATADSHVSATADSTAAVPVKRHRGKPGHTRTPGPVQYCCTNRIKEHTSW